MGLRMVVRFLAGGFGLALLAGVSPAILAQPAPPPVPPPIQQVRTDCSRPQYASDSLICADAALLAADRALAQMAQPAVADDAIWEDQAMWIRRRSLCAFQPDHRACLADAYADRAAVLAGAMLPAGQPLRCDGTWRGRALKAGAFAPGQTVAIAGEHGLLGVASPKPAESTQWQPLLTWYAAGNRIVLNHADGTRMRCRLVAR
jgi:hypothetical protein